MTLTVSLLTERDHAAWNHFVHAHSEGSPFHLTQWRDAITQAFGHKPFYFLAKEEGDIRGVLPIFQLKSFLFGNIFSSVPFAAYGGILADNETAFEVLLEKSKSITREYDANYLELKFQYPKKTGLKTTDLHYTFIKELESNHEMNMNAIPRKQRAMVRKGMKCGLKAEKSPLLLDEFYEIFARNVHRLGTPVYSKKWFRALLNSFGDEAEVLIVRYEGKPISGVLSFYYKDTVLPYYAASLSGYRDYAPNDFQYWQLMCSAVDKGIRYFDYGRSKKGSGHFSFKKHWGFEPAKLHYQFYLNKLEALPEINPLNPKYQRKIRIWKALPLCLTKAIGPHIVKYIP